MGKKTPPKGDLEGSPREAKVPRLDLPALAETASEASNRMEEKAEGTSGSNRCNHVFTDSARTRVSSSLLFKDAGTCKGCRREDALGPRHRKQRPDEISILMCLECGRCFCCGVGGIEYPFGHSRAHAMKKQHWVAVLYDDAEKGYCFKCEAEVRMPAEFEVDAVRWLPKNLLQPLSGVMGHTRLSPQGKGDNNWRNHAEGRISGILNLGEKRHSHEFGSANGQGYAIRGIPNIANTCYMNAILQCLLSLDKLRAMLLAQDVKGLFASALMELFEERSVAGGLLEPEKILACVRFYDERFKGGGMHDSHELLICMLAGLNEEEINLKRKIGGPTSINSIFGFELSQTLSCKCGSKSVTHPFFYDLPLPLPSEGYQTKSVALPQTSESLKSRQKNIALQLFPANEKSNLEKMQTVAESGDSHLLGPELKETIVEETPKPLEVDFTEAQRICQSKDVVHGPLLTHENQVSCFELPPLITEVPVKSVSFLPHDVSDVKVEEMNEMTAGSIVSVEDCLLLFLEEVIDWCCDNCAKDHVEASAKQNKNGEQMVGSTNEDTKVVGDHTEQSYRTACPNEKSSGPSSLSVERKSSNRQPHASDGQSQIIQTVDRITEKTSSGMSYDEKDSTACSITNKEPELQRNKFRAKHSEDVIKQLKMYQDTMKQVELDHSAHQLKDSKNEQEDKVGDAIQKLMFNKMPPVLTLHLKRAFSHNNIKLKRSEHVRFKEYLDLGRFMDPSSVDKDNSLYRLAGVVQHIGTDSLDTGHYIAYVRARRLGNQQQQSSCSSSWFCADDRCISQVTLQEVLKCEAYILFYERVGDYDMAGIRSHN